MFYDDEPVKLPWDYFLTEYERDLLKIPLEDLITKYPNRGHDVLSTDRHLMAENQTIFNKVKYGIKK
jgi:hypothetical protein